ncbi:MAG TPA: cyclase family protein [Chloroflexota bacterium]
MIEIYDLSLTITSDMTTWPGDPGVAISQVHSTSHGDGYNVSNLEMGSHTGTHVDAPRHVSETGVSVDHLPLDVLIGEAWTCHLPTDIRRITADVLDMARIPRRATRVLLATSNSSHWSNPDAAFDHEFVALSEDAADWIVSRGIRVVGIDYLSVGAGGDEGLQVHRSLLLRGVIAVEGLDLRRLPAGPCHLYCLPLKLGNADGAPARVIAVRHLGG